jgi:hypothetical protein
MYGSKRQGKNRGAGSGTGSGPLDGSNGAPHVPSVAVSPQPPDRVPDPAVGPPEEMHGRGVGIGVMASDGDPVESV